MVTYHYRLQNTVPPSGALYRSDGRYRVIDPINYRFLKEDGYTDEQIYKWVAVPPEQLS